MWSVTGKTGVLGMRAGVVGRYLFKLIVYTDVDCVPEFKICFCWYVLNPI